MKNFGIYNDDDSFSFAVSLERGVVYLDHGPAIIADDTHVEFSPAKARWLAAQLIKAAEVLEAANE